MPFYDKHNDSLNKLANQIADIGQLLKNTKLINSNVEEVKKTVLINSMSLAKKVIDLRSFYLSLALNTKNEAVTFDKSIANSLNITINKIDYSDYFVYEITFPIIIPKKESKINKTLWNNSFISAYEHFSKTTSTPITRINNPIVIFENRFIRKEKNNGLKDTDNYELSILLNMFQFYFIEDDRNATIVNRNVFGCGTNGTKVYILSEDNLLDFLLNSF